VWRPSADIEAKELASFACSLAADTEIRSAVAPNAGPTKQITAKTVAAATATLLLSRFPLPPPGGPRINGREGSGKKAGLGRV
jgi:hypothetical protein